MENNPSASSGHSNNFFSGFLLGALVGAAIVFFLGTEKGKRLLKVISEKGLDNISNILEGADKAVGLDEVYEEEDPPFAQPSPRLRPASNAPEKFVSREKVVEERPKVRRFFRGISRHLN